MPIGPDIIDHNSDVVATFVAKSFEDEVKELSLKMIEQIDNSLVAQKPDAKAKRATIDLWNVVSNYGTVFRAASELVEKAYISAGWSKVLITEMGYDRFDNCIRVRLHK